MICIKWNFICLRRFRKFLLWLGTPPAVVRETKPGTFCRIVSEFALEYRTTRDRVLQQLEKKANHRERSKTRGKMITQVANTNTNGYHSLGHEPVSYRSKEDRADAELRQLLGSDISDTESMRTGTWGRSRKSGKFYNIYLNGRYDNVIYYYSVGYGRSASTRDDYLTDTVTDGDDEILESLVKTATRTPTPRERKRNNRPHTQADRSARKYYYFYFFDWQWIVSQNLGFILSGFFIELQIAVMVLSFVYSRFCSVQWNGHGLGKTTSFSHCSRKIGCEKINIQISHISAH